MPKISAVRLAVFPAAKRARTSVSRGVRGPDFAIEQPEFADAMNPNIAHWLSDVERIVGGARTAFASADGARG
jgi:hypothetical protein